MHLRQVVLCLCLAGVALAVAPADAARNQPKRDLSKEYDDLTPSEKIAIRAAAKAAYKAKQLKILNVCADPGNMPLSNIEREGFQNKMAELLAGALGARLNYHWRPFIERGLTRQTFEQGMCDVMFDIPANYARLLTTFPVYKTPYVLVYRNDKGLELTGLDDPKLKDLKIGVFQTSGIRAALAKRGIVDNVKLQTQTHDGDLVPEHQPWYVVQRALDGEFDVAAVFGPFAGWVKTIKNEPIDIVPVNLMDDTVPLEFEMAIGVRKTDAFLKYMIEFALEDNAEKVEQIMKEYGVPLVQCSKCIVPGDLPAHGSYIALADQVYEARPELSSPDQVVTREKLERWLAEGADLTEELANAVLSNDPEQIKFLIEKGADINAQTNQGASPIHTAARHRHPDLVKLLVSLGADVNAVDGKGMTPLRYAAMRDSVPTVKALLESGADTEKPSAEGYRVLALAIAQSRYEAAKALMEAGAEVNFGTGPDALTPLMIAASQSKPAEGARFLPGSTRPIDIARGLLERGADVNAQSKSGTTALMIAATHNNPPMIGLLIESDADADAENNRGETAAGVAELNGNTEAAQAIRVLSAAKSARAPARDEKSSPQ